MRTIVARHSGRTVQGGQGTGRVRFLAPVTVAQLASRSLERLEAHVFSTNPSSRVLEKCGFTREGVLRHAARKRGRLLDLEVWARLRTEQG